MTPNHTAAEVAAMQAAAQEALHQSESAIGLEKLQLINKAFPFAIQGSGKGLLISWAGDGFEIADTGGFITKIGRDDVTTMLVMIGMESGRRGSVREVITGEKKKPQAMNLPDVKFPPFAEKIRRKPGKISLKDLGL